jgi:hypothetical protein
MQQADEDGKPIKFDNHDMVAVPEGYRAVDWSARVLSWHNYAFKNAGASVAVAVGGTSTTARLGVGHGHSMDASLQGVLPDLTGIVPIAVMTDAVWGFGLTFTITCHRLDAHLRKWQQSVYDLIQEAHRQLQVDHENTLSAAAAAEGLNIEGSNPDRNRHVVTSELKKHVIELLAGTQLVGVDAISTGAGGEPQIDVPAMRALAPIVSFMEQAFEWENFSFFLYPYFWSARERWPELAQLELADPEFAAFLAAGSARVIVPARPGHEQMVNFFLHPGVPWLGLQAPAPDDKGYLSIDAEIRALQKGAADGEAVGDPWEVRLPTTLVWLQKSSELPESPRLEPVP